MTARGVAGRRAALLAACALGAAQAGAQSAEVDAERSAWAYRRSVEPAPGASAFVSVTLPPELLARCQADGADLRLVDGSGRELPYLLERVSQRELSLRAGGALVATRRDSRLESSWTVDLGRAFRFDLIEIQTPAADFAKRVRVEVSQDGATFVPAAADAAIFDRPWGNGRQRHTRISLAAPLSARYLQLLADDRRSPPIELTGVEVASTRPLPAEEWSREAQVVPAAARGSLSRYRLDGVRGMPFERLALQADDAAFWRNVRVIERALRNGRAEERTLGESALFKLRLEDSALAAESLSLPLRPPHAGEILLEVDDGDSPPLRRPRVRLSGPTRRLVFARSEGSPALYYGNAVTRASRYDIESLRARLLGAAGARAEAPLGPERANPSYTRPAPLAFAPLRGAPLESRRFSHERRFTLRGSEDLFSLTLGAADVASARADLGDLRLVDAADVQLPFVVEPDAARLRVEMRVEQEPARRRAEGGGGVSRYRLLPPESAFAPAGVAAESLEIEVREAYFSRFFRLLDPDSGGRSGERVLSAATLARRPGESAAPPVLVLPADRRARRLLALEVDEGDDAPLTIERVRAVVSVPRLVFKARPGEYRLLLGNRDVPAGRYDIASLRSEFLTYSATPVTAGPLAQNAGHRRGASELVRGLPGSVLLWSVLCLAVVALLLLTARILREPGGPPPA